MKKIPIKLHFTDKIVGYIEFCDEDLTDDVLKGMVLVPEVRILETEDDDVTKYSGVNAYGLISHERYKPFPRALKAVKYG